MKKVLHALLYMVLTVCILLFGISMCIQPMLVSTLTKGELGNVLSHRMMDVVFETFPEASLDTMLEVQNALGESKEFQEIASSYVNSLVASLDDDTAYPEIPNDMSQLIEENYQIIVQHIGEELTLAQEKSMKEGLKRKSVEVKSVLDEVAGSFFQQARYYHPQLISLYQIISGWMMKIITGFGSILCIGLLCYYQRSHKLCRNFGFLCFAMAILFIFLFPSILASLGSQILDALIGRHLMIDFTSMKYTGLIILLIGIIFEVVYMMLEKINKEELIA